MAPRFTETFLWPAIKARLDAAGSNGLDFLVASHLEEDHMGLAGGLLMFLRLMLEEKSEKWAWVKTMRIISRLKFQDARRDGDPYQYWALPEGDTKET